MKLLLVSILVFVSCLVFLVSVDIFSGIPLAEAIHILAKSFSVITIQEKLVAIAAFLLPFLMPLVGGRFKKNKGTGS